MTARSPVDDLPEYLREKLSPQMRAVLHHQLVEAVHRRQRLTLPEDPWEAARLDYREERAFWNEGGPVMESTRSTTIPAAGVDVPVRIHTPATAASGAGADEGGGTGMPVLLFFHGGGFTLGDLDTHDRVQRMLAHHSGAAVVAVDYSLSPEVKYPQALRECADVAAHLTRHGAEWGLDQERIAFAGDSAGSGLSIGAALLLRDEQPEVFARLRALVLIYGGFGLSDSASRRLWGGDWDGMKMDDLSGFMDALYASEDDARSIYVNPLEADVRGLPPVFLRSAELDPLADDSLAFAEVLRRAGQEHEHHEVPGVLHSYIHFGRMLDAANQTLAEAALFAAARFAG
jgi:acetyl esterase